MKHLLVVLTLLLATTSFGASAESNLRGERLLQLLRAKGVLTDADVAELRTGQGDSESRLIDLLRDKGVLTAAEASELLDAPPISSQESSLNAALVSATRTVEPPSGAQQAALPQQDPLARPPDFGTGEVGQSARALMPRPVEPLPLTEPFPTHTLALRLGSGVTVSPYGMLKASAIYDTNNNSGDDFPFFARVPAAGYETANTTGTLSDAPDFRFKARSARLGVDVQAPDPNRLFSLSGKLEFDFEGSFPNDTNRNIASLHSSQASLRFAWLRLDTRLGNVPVFLKFGQDWSLFASSTQPTGIEVSGNYMWQGNLNERDPGFVTGARFDLGGGWNWRVEPDAGLFLASGGESTAVSPGSPALGSAFAGGSAPAPGQGTIGFGQREGTNSGRPRYEGRLVLEFEPWPDRKIAPSQLIASFQYGERVRYFAPPFQEAGRSFGLRSNSYGYTGEFRFATPWWTLLGKYYRGADLRYYFGGLGQDVFFDGGDPLSAAGGTQQMRPVRSQGGFAQLQLPLSVWLNPESPRLHGFSANLMFGYDSAFARDARRTGQRRAQIALMGNLLYQYNRYLQFAVETDYIETLYTGPQGGVPLGNPFNPATGTSGLQGQVGKNLRFEVGPTFTF